jgi:hypothetical protein
MSCFWCGQHGTSDCQVRGILGDLAPFGDYGMTIAPIKLLILGMAQFIQFMIGFFAGFSMVYLNLLASHLRKFVSSP